MIPSNVCKVFYTGNGATTVYAYTFPIFLATDLVVTQWNALGVATSFVLNTDYTVSGVGAASGSITLTLPLPSSYTILIQRVRPLVQTTDIRNQGPYFPEIHENSFDNACMVDEQIQEQVNRTFTVPINDTAFPSLVLPSVVNRANLLLGFDGNGKPLATAGGFSPSIPVSAYIQTLLGATTAAAARAILLTPNAAETLLNKLLDDSTTNFSNTADPTKLLAFLLSGITTGTKRTWTVPDFSDTMVGLIGTQTLGNKTIDTGPSAANPNVLKSTGASGGQVPTADGANGSAWSTPYLRNHIINGNFSVWQLGTAITGIANASSTYGPDQWYAKNSLGTNGVLRIDQTTAVNSGSQFGCSVKISTAPTAAQANGCELYQTLENLDSILFYNKTASFGVQIKALNNVTQVGIQFFYKTTEAKVDTAIGSEVLVTVNSSTFTRGAINGQAIGTSVTTSGVIGVRIRITGVSTGNTYDINNGFVVEQAMLNNGSYASAGFSRNGVNFQDELAKCLRYLWVPVSGVFALGWFDQTTTVNMTSRLPVQMRVSPTLTITSFSGCTVNIPGTSAGAGSGSVTTALSSTTSVQFTGTSGKASTQGFPSSLAINTAVVQFDSRI